MKCEDCSFSCKLGALQDDLDQRPGAQAQTHDFHMASAMMGVTLEKEKQKRATVNEECPKCGHGKMSFYTLQLRSVDEGQTVFYQCLKCDYKYSTNT